MLTLQPNVWFPVRLVPQVFGGLGGRRAVIAVDGAELEKLLAILPAPNLETHIRVTAAEQLTTPGSKLGESSIVGSIPTRVKVEPTSSRSS